MAASMETSLSILWTALEPMHFLELCLMLSKRLESPDATKRLRGSS
jgi:hypothetical protein